MNILPNPPRPQAEVILPKQGIQDVLLYCRLFHSSNDVTASEHIIDRCGTMHLSEFLNWNRNVLRVFFLRIGPFVHHINVDLVERLEWVPSAVACCTKLKSLRFLYNINNIYHLNTLPDLQNLSFSKMNCNEDIIYGFILNRCRNLKSLSIRETNLTGRFLPVAPPNLRRLNFVRSPIAFEHLFSYVHLNRNLEELSVEMEDETSINLKNLVELIPKMQVLHLRSNYMVKDSYDKLVNLSFLNRLDIDVTSNFFHHYAYSYFYELNLPPLRILNITIDHFTVHDSFARSFKRFRQVYHLSIFVGAYAKNANTLLPYLNEMSTNGGALQSLTLAGFTSLLGFPDAKRQLNRIEQLRVCSWQTYPHSCGCHDHLTLTYRN